jgi:hypothetical protein
VNRFIIIHMRHTKGISPRTCGEFVFTEEFGCWVWGGRSFAQKEFNELMKSKAWRRIVELEGIDRIAPQVVVNNMVSAQAALRKKRTANRLSKSEIFADCPA